MKGNILLCNFRRGCEPSGAIIKFINYVRLVFDAANRKDMIGMITTMNLDGRWSMMNTR